MRSGCLRRRRRRSVISLANRVAGAKTKNGDELASDAESAAIAEITEPLGTQLG